MLAAATALLIGAASPLHAGIVTREDSAAKIVSRPYLPDAALADVAEPSPAVPSAAPSVETTMLVGKNADAIVPDLQAASDVAFVAPPAVASAQAFRRGPEPEVAPRAVTIPFPTALHLFIPGAALALYAARKMSPRYRRRYRPA